MHFFLFLHRMKKLPQNIFNLYLIKIAKWFNLVMPVVVIFYQDNGLNMQDIFLLKSIYSVAIVVMEIPSGYLADVWGRRKTLLLGGVLAATGFAMYSFSYTFWAFVLAEIVLGIGHSFISGADSAMLYDSLKASQKEKEYIKQEGWITSSGNFAEAIAGILGGLLATMSLRWPFFVQFGVASIAIPAAFFLKEPIVHLKKVAPGFRDILATVKNSFTNPLLRAALLTSSFTGTASLTFAWFVQPYFQEAGLPLSLFGLMWTLLNLSVGLSAIFSYKIERKFGRKFSLLGIVILLSLGYFLSAIEISLAGIALLFFFYLVRGVAHPILKDYINQYTDAKVRATILSVRNFIIRINFAIIGPVLGYITDHFSLKLALILTGAGYLISGLASMIPLLKKEQKSSN